MSSWLRKSVQGIAGAVLMVASVTLMLVLIPSVAEAQSDDRGASSTVVVRPGDSLWSITSDQLGPNASPRQIANGVERIYALNKGRIGADPGLIFPGQELSLPPMGASSTAEAAPAAIPAKEDDDTAASPTASGDKVETERISSKVVGEAGSEAGRKSGSAHDPAGVPLAIPDMPAEQVTPQVGLLPATEASSPLEFFARIAPSWATSAVVWLFPQDDRLLGRRLLGLGIIGLNLLVAALMLWKLPMRRSTDFDEVYVGTRLRPASYASYYNAPPPQDDAHRRRGGTHRHTPKPEAVASGWQPSAEFEASLSSMPLQETLIPLENLTKIKYQVEVALEELAWLDERRGLFDTECRVEAALEDLLEALSAMERAHG